MVLHCPSTSWSALSMVPSLSESPTRELSSAFQDNLLRNFDDSRLLVILNDDAVVLETNRLEVLTDLMNRPLLRCSLPIHCVAPHATALGFLHHQNCQRFALDLIRFLNDLITCCGLIATKLVLRQ